MILLFFSVWAIAIALGEVMFSAQPFSLDSIISTLPHTLFFSALLSAAVYLAKSKIIDAIHKGRPIDKKFVAEITPEVGHELNKMRNTIASYDDDQSENWRNLDNPDFKGKDYALAQELFAKLSAASARGAIDPDNPELKEIIARAKEAGLDIQDLMAMAEGKGMPIFPDFNLPDEPQSNLVSENIEPAPEKEEPVVPVVQDEVIDPAVLDAKEKNIAELVDKYRSQGHFAPKDVNSGANSMASLERLAAPPEFKAPNFSKHNTPAKSLKSAKIQPIRSINIQEREKQQALEQARLQQRRSAQLNALAEVVSDEDELISQFRAAAAEGNQLIKAKAQPQSTAPAPRVASDKDKVQTKPSHVRPAHAPKSNYTSQVKPRVNAPVASVSAVATATTNTELPSANAFHSTNTATANVASKPQFELEFAQPKKQPETILESSDRVTSSFKEQSVELGPQDQVMNVYDVQEQALVTSRAPQVSAPRMPNEGQEHERIAIDNPSLVDTSKLKKYKYVPPKKGAGLDTSALKKVTLPNYHSSNGPSRLGATTTTKIATAHVRSAKKTVASTASLSVEERQELMARLRKNNQGTELSRMSKQAELRKTTRQSSQPADMASANSASRLSGLAVSGGATVGVTSRTNPSLKSQYDFVIKSSPQSGSGSEI